MGGVCVCVPAWPVCARGCDNCLREGEACRTRAAEVLTQCGTLSAQATAVLIEQVGLLSRTRDELLAEVATLEETLPAELQSVQADRAAASRHTVAANLRGSLLHVLSYVAGGVAIHPTELPAIIKGVTAALAPRVPDADGDTAAAATAVLPPIQAMRQAILAVTNTEL